MNDSYEMPREQMIEHQLRVRGIRMQRVLDAMRAVPRHLFVRHDFQSRAYADEALPSCEGQTISQPYMVALMTQELDVHPGMRVLELGTGTGYQTAILAQIVGTEGRIYTVERVTALAEAAERRLRGMDYSNVRYFVGDGSAGWPRDQWDQIGDIWFDRILVTAGAPAIPDPLLHQLSPGGIIVLPLGDGENQILHRVLKRHDGSLQETQSVACRFVPLLGNYGWNNPSD